MDLRSLANSVSNTINPNMIVSVQVSTGYTIGGGLKQVPTYAAPVSGPAQLQALDGSELRQIDNLNLQGVLRTIYLRGPLAGIIRPDSKGGDLVTISAPAPIQFRGTWLVVKVFETWPLWTKCAINRQVLPVAAPLPSLLRWWKMNEGSGNVFVDSSASSDNTVLSGADATWGSLPGYSTTVAAAWANDYSMNFSQSGLTFQPFQPFSLVAWINPADFSFPPRGVMNLLTSAYAGWSLALYEQIIFQLSSVNGVNMVQVTAPIAAETTQMIVVTYDGSSSVYGIQVYVNGVLQTLSLIQDSLTSSIDYSGANGAIGSNLSGFTSDFRIYSGVLSALNVSDLFTAGPA